MTQLLLIAHTPLAQAFKSCAMHTYPECSADVLALDVLPEWDAAKVEAEARLLLAHHQGDVLILTDMLGATPANGAQRLAGDHVRVVSGLNVPMLWRALCYRQQALDVIADKALTGACVHELGCTS
ncbi:MAG: PTS fructose transporter subunit IIA [Burkholderiaceae bacterium]|nr:MAG: PTS fructose transporter subunit IIA [Burkholderiaceae bacterium]